jgi:hypothetical protein
MTDTDALVGAGVGLLGLAIAVNIAGKVLKGTKGLTDNLKIGGQKGSNKSKSTKIKW